MDEEVEEEEEEEEEEEREFPVHHIIFEMFS